MAINVTVRDIINFPGGTAKTVSLDVIQVVPAGGSPEGDEIWVTSTTTSATASGTLAIQDIFKNELKRGFIRSSGFITGLINVGVDSRLLVAIDEDISQGLEIVLKTVTNALATDVAQDIESKIRTQAQIGAGGLKVGNLSYLNVQVRFQNNKFSIESGNIASTFTGVGRSSVSLGIPAGGIDIRPTLGFDIVVASESLAARQIIETDLTANYTGGDTLTVRNTAGLVSGDAFEIRNTTNTDIALVSGINNSSIFSFTVFSGGNLGLSTTFDIGSMVRKLHPVDVADPVSAVTTIDQLYRSSIDSVVNQIDFSS